MIRYFILSILFFSACAPRPQNVDKVLAEALVIQAEALKIGQETQTLLQDLEQRRNSIEVQGRALTNDEIQLVDQINNLLARLEEWKEKKPTLPAQIKGNGAALLEKQQKYLETIQTIRGEAALLLQ